MNISKIVQDLKLIVEENKEQQPVFLEYAIEKWIREYHEDFENELREAYQEGCKEADEFNKEEIEELKSEIEELKDTVEYNKGLLNVRN